MGLKKYEEEMIELALVKLEFESGLYFLANDLDDMVLGDNYEDRTRIFYLTEELTNELKAS